MGKLDGLTPPIKKLPCRVRSVLAELTDNDRDILTQAINDHETWLAKPLCRALRERGIMLSDDAIYKHRKGLCSC